MYGVSSQLFSIPFPSMKQTAKDHHIIWREPLIWKTETQISKQIKKLMEIWRKWRKQTTERDVSSLDGHVTVEYETIKYINKRTIVIIKMIGTEVKGNLITGSQTIETWDISFITQNILSFFLQNSRAGRMISQQMMSPNSLTPITTTSKCLL